MRSHQNCNRFSTRTFYSPEIELQPRPVRKEAQPSRSAMRLILLPSCAGRMSLRVSSSVRTVQRASPLMIVPPGCADAASGSCTARLGPPKLQSDIDFGHVSVRRQKRVGRTAEFLCRAWCRGGSGLGVEQSDSRHLVRPLRLIKGDGWCLCSFRFE